MKFKNRPHCHSCNFSLSGKEKFCPECGSRLFTPDPDPIHLPHGENPDVRASAKKGKKPEIILDPGEPGLEWLIGPDRDTSWHEANEWVNKLPKTSGNQWRMPTRCELQGLYDDSVVSHCKIKPRSSSWLWVWSGENRTDQGPTESETAWGFDFRSGLEFWGGCNESLRSRVFAVRKSSAG